MLTKDTKINIPKLRFKEFGGEWEAEKLGSLTAKVGSGSTPRGGEKVYQDHGVVFIRSQNINNGQLELVNPTYISEKTNSEMKNTIVRPKDVLLNITGASLGRSCVVPSDFSIGNVNQHVCIIRVNDNNTPVFIHTYLGSYKGQKSLLQLQTGSGREGLNFQGVRALKIYVPGKEEQEKIAGFFTTVDEKITNLESKKTQFEKYKQGVMQAIFSQSIRFNKPDGTSYSDWEEEELGKLLDYEQPTKYIVNSTEYSNNYKTPVLTAGKTFILGYTDEKNNIFGDLPVIIFDDFTTASQFVTFPFKVKSSAMKILKAKKNENVRFIFEAMQQVEYEVGGHGRHWISVFSNMKISTPSADEQEKIAELLASLDNKFELINKELGKAKEFKKGLLQQMFV